jgi:hypothetical protein
LIEFVTVVSMMRRDTLRQQEPERAKFLCQCLFGTYKTHAMLLTERQYGSDLRDRRRSGRSARSARNTRRTRKLETSSTLNRSTREGARARDVSACLRTYDTYALKESVE